MSLSRQRVLELESLCRSFRIDLIRLLYRIQTGHPGGSLSCTEIITTLYQEKMNIRDPLDPGRDRFILSKGHAAPMLYLNLAQKGFFPKSELSSLRQYGSILQGHPCAHKTPGVEVSTGPLGLGLSAALGVALSAKFLGQEYATYVLLGDGELQEGCIWETAMAAAKFAPRKLIAIVDHNHVQLDGTNDEVMPLGDLSRKFSSFGWQVFSCSGHNISALSDTIDQANTVIGKPCVILAETVKGKGISFMEGKSAWNGKPLALAEYNAAIQELGGVNYD